MTESMPIIEARNKLTSLPEALQNQPELGAIAITRRGQPVLALMSWELYESLLETIEIVSDEKLMPLLRQSIREAAAGQVKHWDAVKNEQGL